MSDFLDCVLFIYAFFCLSTPPILLLWWILYKVGLFPGPEDYLPKERPNE